MGELNWQENSKELFDKMMAVVPDEMKTMAEQMLMGMIAAKAGSGQVTGQVLAEVVEGLPEPQKSVLKGVLSSASAPDTAIQWEDSSVERLFGRLVLAAPKGMQETFRGVFLSMLRGMAGSAPVTAEMIKQMVEGSPEPQRSVLMRVIAAPEGADPEQVRRIIEKYGKTRESISSVLREVVNVMGHLTHGTALEVARQTGIAVSHIYHLVTTQRSFSITPPAGHQVKVCAGTVCRVRDKARDGEALEKASAAKQDVSLDKVRCFGCCDCGPMAEVDGEKVSLEKARARVEGL